MVCPVCKHVYCWICKKNLEGIDYDHFEQDKDPFGCANLMYTDFPCAMPIMLTLRVYTLPYFLWKKYINDPVFRRIAEGIENYAQDKKDIIGAAAMTLMLGIFSMITIVVFMTIIYPPIMYFLVYKNVWVFLKKYLLCCCC